MVASLRESFDQNFLVRAGESGSVFYPFGKGIGAVFAYLLDRPTAETAAQNLVVRVYWCNIAMCVVALPLLLILGFFAVRTTLFVCMFAALAYQIVEALVFRRYAARLSLRESHWVAARVIDPDTLQVLPIQCAILAAMFGWAGVALTSAGMMFFAVLFALGAVSFIKMRQSTSS